MKHFLSLLLFCCSLPLFSQTFYPEGSAIHKKIVEAEKCYIMPSYVVIPDATAPRDAKGVRPRLKAKIKHIDALLRRDVIAYYDLEEIHNSPLKRKMYLASDDYKKRLALMEKQRAAFLDHEYYITFHADALSSTDEEVAPLLLIPTHVYLVHQKTGQIFCSYDATATSLFDEADEADAEEDFDAE